MNYDEIRKLLGGYATGTLTPEEKRTLMAAAMEDQRIFDALADDEALRELLADPSFRQELLVELRQARPGLPEKIAAWWRRPLPLALAGGLAMVALAALVLVPMWQHEEAVDVAMRQKAPQESLMPSEETGREMEARPVAQPANEAAAAPTAPEDRLTKEESAKSLAAGGRGGGGGGSVSPPPSPEPLRSNQMERKDLDAPAAPKKRVAAQQVGASADLRERRRIAEAAEVDQEKAPAAMAFRSTGQSAMMDESVGQDVAQTQVRVEKLAADGIWVTVEPGGLVRLSDTLRMEVVAPTGGHVYVLISDSAAPWALAAEVLVPGGRPVYVPAEGGLPRPPRTVERTVAVVFSPAPLAAATADEVAILERRASVRTVIRYE